MVEKQRNLLLVVGYEKKREDEGLFIHRRLALIVIVGAMNVSEL